MRISPGSLALSPGETGTIEVGGGRYPYESAISSDESVATASLNGQTVTVRAVAEGTAEIDIHDSDEYSGTVDVTVTTAGQAQNPDDVNSDDDDANPGDSDEVIVADNVRVLEASAMEHLTYTSENKDELIFGSQAEQVSDLKPDDIIVSGEGEGLLRRVISLENSEDQIVVRTSEASLTNVFEKCNVSFSGTLNPDDIESSDSRSERNRPRRISEEFLQSISIEQDGGVSLTGSLSFRTELDIQIVIEDFHMEYFKAAVSMTETAALKLRADYEMSIGIEKELADFRLRPIVLWAGGIPIVITPVIRIVGGIQGHVNMEVETSVTQKATLTAGAEYRNQQWNDISDSSNEFDFSPPAPTANADAKGYVGAALDFLFYGSAGPYVNAYPYLRAQIALLSSPCWALYGGIDAGAGVRVKLLDKEMADYGKSDMISLEELLKKAGTDEGTSVTSPENGSEFDSGDLISFSSRNDDICGFEYLTWTSSIDGLIGQGSSVSRSDLSVGTHLISLSGEHYLNPELKRGDQIQITVKEDVKYCYDLQEVCRSYGDELMLSSCLCWTFPDSDEKISQFVSACEAMNGEPVVALGVQCSTDGEYPPED